MAKALGQTPDDDAGEDAGRKAFVLRLPPDLARELKLWASQEVRSLNGQIEYLLRDAVQRRHKSRSGPA